MSRLTIQLRKQHQAQQEFESQATLLQRDLGEFTETRFLWLRVRVLELLVEQTGGNLKTEGYRLILADLKKAVALRAVSRRSARASVGLHVVRA